MDASTAQSFHKAIRALDVAGAALNSLQSAIEAEQGRVLGRALTGEDQVCHLPNPEMLPDASPLRSLRSGLCRLLTEGTLAAHVVVVLSWENEDDDHSVYTVALSHELPRTIDTGVVHLSFRVELNGTINCVASHGKRVVGTAKLNIDGSAYQDIYPYGDVALVAFSTQERAIAWCEDCYRPYEMCGGL